MELKARIMGVPDDEFDEPILGQHQPFAQQ